MSALVECRGLTCGYDPESPTLHDVELDVAPGEFLAVLGSSGCGKSTLMRTMVGLLPPLTGDVKLFGEPLYESPARRDRLLRRTGTAFQQDALFGGMTVAENVALPLRELTTLPGAVVDEMVRMRLGLVGLAGFERRPATELSGGERKRAALARATILDPELVFCDEPSAGLDPVVAAGIDSMLITLRDTLGSAFVIVTHELASIRTIADRAVMLASGTVHVSGTIDELSASRDAVVFNFFHRVAEPMAER